ncbi:hypothetical protein ABDD95_00715 [Mucilaginibacter sp. PAMB04274]|uniref:hypothetical protein n=1 Tax=Mucilaginibacter sp. PAMB04274 TaxID=3138568 RepID=UPI0031F693ED
MKLDEILKVVPNGLKLPLITEYNSIIKNYMEHRWTAAELSGGKFCEIVYTILDGYSKGSFESSPSKPSNFVDACRKLENKSNVPRSFQILIPRMLPALYEIRNNRNVGHIGGDVDPNIMDSQAVAAMCSWILGEIIRVLHNTTILDAQKIVDFITIRKIPIVWDIGNIKRILEQGLNLKDKILLLMGSSQGATSFEDLIIWTEYKDRKYFLRSLRELHSKRLIEMNSKEGSVDLLPPGSLHVEKLILKLTSTKNR